MRFLHPTILISLLAMTAAHARQSGRERVLKTDAVALIDQQREVEGKVDFQQQHGRYTYLFANDANRKAFEANPAKYEIQQGGACGRMGPLSGEGSPKLFGVHDGRLYLFASEQCRRAFTQSPDAFLDVDDPKPQATEESLRLGRGVVDMIAVNAGLSRTTSPLTSLRQTRARTEESGGKTYAVTETFTLVLPDAACIESCWDQSCWSNVLKGDDGWSVDSKGSHVLAMSQVRALQREAARHPCLLVANRERSDFIAVDAGRRTLAIDGEGSIDCALADVHWRGATTTLGVDATGKVRLVSYRGRGPDATIGRIEQVFSEFRIVDGFEFPGRVRTTFKGKAEPTLSGRLTNQAANDPIHTSKCDQPAPPAQ